MLRREDDEKGKPRRRRKDEDPKDEDLEEVNLSSGRGGDIVFLVYGKAWQGRYSMLLRLVFFDPPPVLTPPNFIHNFALIL